MLPTILATDLDGTFLGGTPAQRDDLYRWINVRRSQIILIYVTGRSLTAMQDVLHDLPVRPDHIIADVGTNVYAGQTRTRLMPVEDWLNEAWPDDANQRIERILRKHPHLQPQPVVEGRRVSCFYTDADLARVAAKEVQTEGFDVLMSAGEYFDVLPRGVQKGPTLIKTLQALGLPKHRTLVAGDTLNDLSLYQTGLRGVVVANREPLLAHAVQSLDNVYQSNWEGAAGVLDALQRFH